MQGIVLFYKAPRPTLGPTQLPIQWVPQALFPGIKRPMREADHSCPSGMKTEFGYTSVSPYAFVACADQVSLPIKGVNGYTAAFF